MSKLINKILLIMSTILILFVVSFSAVFGYLFFQHSQNIESSRLESTALSLADKFIIFIISSSFLSADFTIYF